MLSGRRRAVPLRPIGLLGVVATVALAGCQILRADLPPAPTAIAGAAPTAIAEPAPGHVRIVSRPAAPSFPIEIRFHAVGPGGPSRDFFEFAVNERILIVFPGVPPTSSSLQINGVRCGGQWTFEPSVETDVVLSFDDASCRTDVLGKHAWGTVHNEPGKDSGFE
jgi:hypothetical protein